MYEYMCVSLVKKTSVVNRKLSTKQYSKTKIINELFVSCLKSLEKIFMNKAISGVLLLFFVTFLLFVNIDTFCYCVLHFSNEISYKQYQNNIIELKKKYDKIFNLVINFRKYYS